MFPEVAMMSDEEVFRMLCGKVASYEDFKNKSEEEKTQVLKEHYLNPMKEYVYSEFQIPSDTPLEQVLAQVKEQESAIITARFENRKKPHTYTYRIEYKWLGTEMPYVTGTPWYRQPGTYSFRSNLGSGIQNVRIRKKDSPQDDRFDASGYNGSGDITAKTGDGKQITVTVTDKGSGKVEVACAGAVSFTEELTFRGNPIPRNPLWN